MVKIEGSEMYLIPSNGELLEYECSICNKKYPYPIWSTNERYQILDNAPKCDQCYTNIVCYGCEDKFVTDHRMCLACIKEIKRGFCCGEFAIMIFRGLVASRYNKFKPDAKFRICYDGYHYDPPFRLCPWCGKEL